MSIIKFMEQNGYGIITTHMIQELEYLMKDHAPDLIEQAIKISIENNARKLNYIKKILSNWETEGITTLADYHAKTKPAPKETGGFLSLANGG